MGAKDLEARDNSRSNRPSVSRHGSTTQVGLASWYGRFHAGRKTASGERFDPRGLTGAHRTLPMGSIVRVTCRDTGKSVTVTINDRGPYVRPRIIDLSEGAARRLGFREDGLCRVTLEVLYRPEPRDTVEVAESPEPRRRR